MKNENEEKVTFVPISNNGTSNNDINHGDNFHKLMEVQSKLLEATEEKIKLNLEVLSTEKHKITLEEIRIKELNEQKCRDELKLSNIKDILIKIEAMIDNLKSISKHIMIGTEEIHEIKNFLEEDFMDNMRFILTTIPLNLEVNRTIVQHMISISQGNKTATEYFSQILERIEDARKIFPSPSNVTIHTTGSINSGTDTNVNIKD